MLQTHKCLQLSHQGKRTSSWSVQEYFVNRGWVLFVGICISKKKTCWWVEKTPRPCCLSTAVYLGSRSLQAQEHCWNKTHVDTLLLPSAAALLRPAAHTSTCVHCSLSPARAGGCKALPSLQRARGTQSDPALLAGVFKAQTTLLLSRLVSLAEMVLLCHLVSSGYSSGLLCPGENIAIAQGWVMALLKNWMEKLVFLQYYYLFFLIQSATFYFTCSSFSEMGRCLRRTFIRKCFILKCLRKDLKSLGNFRVWGFFFSGSVWNPISLKHQWILDLGWKTSPTFYYRVMGWVQG